MQRLGRIITAIEADQSRPSPRTVEKVLMMRGEDQLGDVTVDIRLDTAGANATRKRLARDLASAAPCGV